MTKPSTFTNRAALVLLSHGSLLCGAGQALDEHVGRLRKMGEWLCVEAGFLNYTSPHFLEAVRRCVERGAKMIVVQPYFLVAGKFVTEDLPEQIAQARAEFPDLEFVIGEPIGFDAMLADAILELAAQPRPPQQWRDDLLRAPDYCTRNPECPLYGTEHCPVSLAGGQR
ncbi:MAG: hypothetical protein D6691_01065 [Candidatus Hydrogenedentota bacterium]|uniref:Sirohydrochlorin cobaltochelatase n=1 Tax=Sumerlaea chitinivorans TaxID=2250252 RepID=A0A2Z4Y6Z7_SUMC1|nr:Sirohydrochlorin cobaltochelatase [Candidatus Sumerlaea chitinivorans]RMH30619.1 MAG: hypothetical protein D6691_01065 [Candidatus Hydrogenedentota bacterium]